MGGGGTNNKKAFTLIELLAIIVILAIIAVITVPIILNVIDNAKKGSVIDSAYGYKDAVQKFYVSKLYEDANFKFENGTYTVETLKTMGVSVDGTSPTDDSWVEITNNQVNDYSLKFDEWVVNYDKNTKQPTATKGDVRLTLLKTTKEDGRKYYSAEWVSANPIYFNPEQNGTVCTENDYNNNADKLGKTGCMKWYAYSENSDGTINMILDHNTTPKVAWVSKDDYGEDNSGIPQKAKDVGLTYPNISEENPYGIFNTSNRIYAIGDAYDFGNWNKGPITLLYQLQQDTNSWSSNVISRDSYGSHTDKNNLFDYSNPNNPNYTINYSGYNARLITAQEVAYITDASYDGEPFDERTTDEEPDFSTTTYAWLLENINSSGNPAKGYWTVSSYNSNEDNAWHVYYYGKLNYYGNVNDAGVYSNNMYGASAVGLRPVIAVSSSVLSGS